MPSRAPKIEVAGGIEEDPVLFDALSFIPLFGLQPGSNESSQEVVVLECASRARPAPTAVPECRGGPGHGDQRRGQQEGALWPRAARMHLAGRFFMTPGVARGPPERGMDLDLSQLTLAEKEAILRVIKRDEALRKMEERRIL
ncbi:hypothetical protein IscW_ISCW007922 [Ixodes scapularis]|uniref:RabBD domain-containing protein n=1 Tax=Ixodes scapularis TaxID=6945 RepID=B7PUV9_IXOSC|nr:hypothetical protein IscW_ISCW007922 [Ixodes scapularis]|eukprot:XP_002406903.1 hypothetical protein IscW_ISCW007922 [Ixodes scapularis]